MLISDKLGKEIVVAEVIEHREEAREKRNETTVSPLTATCWVRLSIPGGNETATWKGSYCVWWRECSGYCTLSLVSLSPILT
jgi:hypothetical protein